METVDQRDLRISLQQQVNDLGALRDFHMGLAGDTCIALGAKIGENPRDAARRINAMLGAEKGEDATAAIPRFALRQHGRCGAYLRHLLAMNPSLDQHADVIRVLAAKLEDGSAALPFPNYP